eukprot:1948526-Pyramimonas_sp.AAC.1
MASQRECAENSRPRPCESNGNPRVFLRVDKLTPEGLSRARVEISTAPSRAAAIIPSEKRGEAHSRASSRAPKTFWNLKVLADSGIECPDNT